MKYDFEIFADYFQIYIEDSSVQNHYQLTWGDDDLRNRMVSLKGVMVISTARNMDVPFSIEICYSRPDIDFMNWDHINERAIEIESGTLNIFGATDYIGYAKR